MSKFLEKHMNTPPSSPRNGQEEPLIASSASNNVAPASISLLMVMVFLEAIGLYGLIVALILSSHDSK